jgi:hypothetical protein
MDEGTGSASSPEGDTEMMKRFLEFLVTVWVLFFVVCYIAISAVAIFVSVPFELAFKKINKADR